MGTTPQPDWKQVRKIKEQCVSQAAENAMAQQTLEEKPEVRIPFPESVKDGPRMAVTERDSDFLRIEMRKILAPHGQPVPDTVRFRLPEPMDFLEGGSGLAVIVRAEANSSPEVRLGLRLIGTDGNAAMIEPYIPVLSAWGDETHEIYFDWSFINYGKVEEAIGVLRHVTGIEFLCGASLRAPRRGASRSPQDATIRISELRLVAYLHGSYDVSRHRPAKSQLPDLSLQHRCQEVTGLTARFGGEAGRRSAMASLDLCVRTQCWDGSFLVGRKEARTVTSGEYTYGFTVYGLLTGYLALEEADVPELEAEMKVGPIALPRRQFYHRMFYRAAMSRAIALPETYRDDIISENMLISSANRVMGYAIAMFMVAEIMPDEGRRREILSFYNPLMDALVDAQGRYSGGFPLLAEGDRFEGRGIHYDCGYIRTHMDWLIVGVQRTRDMRFVQILRRYQEVFEATMDALGTGILPLISERGTGARCSVRLIIPDSTAQVGMEYDLPIIAQWGHNCSQVAWQDPFHEGSGNFWVSVSRMKGYSLGTFAVRLIDDFDVPSAPEDIGYRFPRQFPFWSSTLFDKAGHTVSTSRVIVHPDGRLSNDFRIDVGLYPRTVGVPVWIESPDGALAVTARELLGWPARLTADAKLEVSVDGKPAVMTVPDETVHLQVEADSRITITGPYMVLPPDRHDVPFRATFDVSVIDGQKPLTIRLRVMKEVVPYLHETETGI